MLGISQYRVATSRLEADERELVKLDTLGGNQEVSIISESGLYTLILRSNKPEARPFRRWVTREVLPALRRTGVYQLTSQDAPDMGAMDIEVRRRRAAAAIIVADLRACRHLCGPPTGGRSRRRWPAPRRQPAWTTASTFRGGETAAWCRSSSRSAARSSPRLPRRPESCMTPSGTGRPPRSRPLRGEARSRPLRHACTRRHLPASLVRG